MYKPRCTHANKTCCWSPGLDAGCGLQCCKPWALLMLMLIRGFGAPSRLPLMLGPGWQSLSAQGDILVKPVFFCTETG